MQKNNPVPRKEIHGIIGKYIKENPDGDFRSIIKADGRWEVFSELSGRAGALFGWYDFKKGSSILQINAGFGTMTAFLCSDEKKVTAVESDPFEAECIMKRCGNYNSLTVINDTYENICGTFDYIIYCDDEDTAFYSFDEYKKCAAYLKSLLAPDGRLLFTVKNRFGIKYLSGEAEKNEAFDGITENRNVSYRFGRNELINMLSDIGFEKVKLYYPLPDHVTAQLIYTDELKPGKELSERLRPYVVRKGSRVLNEAAMFGKAAENDGISLLSNSFIAECGNDVSKAIYASISSERDRDKAFSTVIYSDNTVRKIPLYRDNIKGLERLVQNLNELSERGVPVINADISDGTVIMEKINSPTLADHFRQLVKGNREEFIACIDQIYKYILMSSEQVSADKNALKKLAPDEDWGPILKKVYIEMIPVNCFYTEKCMMFFDQEFTADNYPAKYILFRTLRDIYAFIPEAEQLMPRKEIEKHYNIEKLWDHFQREESRFQTQLRQWDIYTNHFKWVKSDENAIKRNRRMLAMNNENEKNTVSERMFDPVYGIENRKIVIFGAGKMLEHYINKYGRDYAPEFVVDNNSDVWGSEKLGFEIKSPDVLSQLDLNKYRIIIAGNAYRPIASQLEQIGISESNYRVYHRPTDELLGAALTDTITDGKYNVGYVTGAFDLFHIGHLNVLKNSKSRCHYLIAGVLTDEIIINEKHKTPYIPFEERIEIVKQCRYVDRVVPIDSHNTNKIDAWRELRYGCLFSGSDHESQPYWIWLQKQLRCLGSDLEFFPYTESTSSTMLQRAISEAVNK